nr:response regulator [Deltaproteobacteria bacterium]
MGKGAFRECRKGEKLLKGKSVSVPATAVIVNDDVTQLAIMSELLKKSGITVQSYQSAESALTNLNPDKQPSIIITDLYMPGIDGWRFCRLLRSLDYAAFNDTPILVVSATFAGDDAHRIATDLGANAFMSSPINGKQFIQQVRTLIQGSQPAQSLSILIVEDSRTQALMLQRAFTAHGYTVLTAATGAEARTLFENHYPEMVVLDYHLPDAKGDELLDEFLNAAPRTVMIMTTADTNPRFAAEWMKRGIAAYVRKPFESEYLIALCENARRERSLLQVEELLEQRTRALREAECLYRSVVENQTEMVCRWIPDTTTLMFVNEACCRYFGKSREDLLGSRLLDLIPEQIREKRRNDIQSLIQSTEAQTSEIQIIAGDGSVRWIQNVDTPVIGKGGRVIEVLSVGRDITKRKETEETLERRVALERVFSSLASSFVEPGDLNSKIRNALRTIGECTTVDRTCLLQVSEDAKTVTDFQEWCREGIESPWPDLIGVSLEREFPWLYSHLQKREALDIYSGQDLPEGACLERRLLAGNKVKSLLALPILTDKKLMGLIGLATAYSMTSWPEENMCLLQLTGEVIGRALERKRAEETLRESQERLQRAQKRESLIIMASGVAHHFNNLLTVVINSVEIARSKCADDSALDHYLKGAQTACKRAADLSRLMSTYIGQSRGDRSVIDLGKEIQELVPLIRSAMPDRIALEADVPAEPYAIDADPGEIHQVVMNLATNAWEAIGSQSGTVRISVSRSFYDEPDLSGNVTGDRVAKGEYVCFEISDTGIGMSKETLDNVFDPFFSTKFTGRGLGLPIILGIVRMYRGAISISSEPDQGCRIRILLPAAHLREVPQRAEAAREPDPQHDKGAVLLVDDEEMLQTVIIAALNKCGFAVFAAASGQEALELFRQHAEEVQCVLLDLTMPEMDGWETMRRLKEMQPEIYIILSTGYDIAHAQKEHSDMIPDAWIQKPFHMKQLQKTIEQCRVRKKTMLIG